ncbi:MAG: hypothetical protein N2648_00055 [Aquificaceae bacterium]|nr:hypothetical protein [Aquificaceae bacterium]MDW8032104.1 hypothetical protein [Aquificaceae bacterium]MDW8294395.1 hypothetical protein [Aquificaceae bacterium]
MLKRLILHDWHYKLLSLVMGVVLWFVLNMGERVPLGVERQIEMVDQEKGYEYRLERKRVKIRLRVMERFVHEETLEKITASVSLRGLKEGEHTLKVEVKNVPKFLVSVERTEPEYVKVRVIKAPEGGQ